MSLSRYCIRLRPTATSSLPTSRTLPTRRYASTSDTPTPDPNANNPILAEYLKKNPQITKTRAARPAQKPPTQGSLATNSIFSSLDPGRARRAKTNQDATRRERDPAVMAAKLDPQPEVRRRWERKMVIKAIQRRGRLSRTQIVKRTEREFSMASEFMKTSVKKLGPLARQIAGKPIEEAIVQMQYSKKKAAVEIHNHLIEARDRAVVERGMGLGIAEGNPLSRKVIKLADGTRHTIYDQTGIYVEQAWVNKGAYGMDSSPRARGRVDRLRLPQTNITVKLKEEATRLREYAEREKREKAKKIWVHHPDRPITTQRPYYCW